MSGVLFAYTQQKVRKQKHPAIAITGLKSETKPIVSNFSKTKTQYFCNNAVKFARKLGTLFLVILKEKNKHETQQIKM